MTVLYAIILALLGLLALVLAAFFFVLGGFLWATCWPLAGVMTFWGVLAFVTGVHLLSEAVDEFKEEVS